MSRLMKWCLVVLLLAAPVRAEAVEDSLRFGAFGKVKLYYESRHPANVVLFVSGDGGWNLGVVDMARTLATLDAVVAGVDITHYLRALEGSSEACLYPAGDFENLSKAVQQHLDTPAYTTPVLVGYSSGATLVYAALVQGPPNTFKGAISLGFCPDLPLDRPMCHGHGLEWTAGPGGKGYSFLPASTLEIPWVALQGEIDQVCNAAETQAYVSKVPNGEIVMLPKVGHGFSVQKNWMPQFKAAFARIAADTTAREAAPSGSAREAAGAGEPGGLPLVEARAASEGSDALVILLSGDGGWSLTERGVSHDLVEGGVSVVGWNSLRYYWKKRTPDEASADLTRIARHYLKAWGKSRLVLVGYSFGADVLPFLVSRLPADLRDKVASVVLIGLSSYADFGFHLGNWLGTGPSTKEYPTLPEIRKLRGMRITAFHGERDSDAVCLKIDPGLATCVTMPGGHLVWKGVTPITREILKQVK
jgi:type IV secretory pathway VirJ component